MTLLATPRISEPAAVKTGRHSSQMLTLAAAILGFFIVTLDAVVVNVALPSIRSDFSPSVAGLQWVVDGYTLMFAALLIASGSLSDRIGARRSFILGLAIAAAVALVAAGLSTLLRPTVENSTS